jgi:hypothetical protein
MGRFLSSIENRKSKIVNRKSQISSPRFDAVRFDDIGQVFDAGEDAAELVEVFDFDG